MIEPKGGDEINVIPPIASFKDPLMFFQKLFVHYSPISPWNASSNIIESLHGRTKSNVKDSDLHQSIVRFIRHLQGEGGEHEAVQTCGDDGESPVSPGFDERSFDDPTSWNIAGGAFDKFSCARPGEKKDIHVVPDARRRADRDDGDFRYALVHRKSSIDSGSTEDSVRDDPADHSDAQP